MRKYWIHHRLFSGSLIRESEPVEARDAEEAVARYQCRVLNGRDLKLYDDWDKLAQEYAKTHSQGKGFSHVHAELVE